MFSFHSNYDEYIGYHFIIFMFSPIKKMLSNIDFVIVTFTCKLTAVGAHIQIYWRNVSEAKN